MSSRIVLITGATSGVGYATAKVLASASTSHHVIVAGRTLEKAQAACATLEAEGVPAGNVSAVQLEVTSQSSIEAAAAHITQRFGRLDVLMNNAGIGGQGDGSARELLRQCLAVNVEGPAAVSDAFRPLLLKSERPYSIFVSTGQRSLMRHALEKPPHFSNLKNTGAYQVSKAALNMLGALEARNYGSDGLKVFVLSPGFVRSLLRGTSEEQISGWGGAGDPEVPARVVLDIVQGKRDDEAGHFVHKDGVYEW